MNALLVGCGSKFGLELNKIYQSFGYSVISLGSNPVEGTQNIIIDWNTLSYDDIVEIAEKLPNLDVIFFNQKYGSGPENNHFDTRVFNIGDLKRWTQAYWVNCQMPFCLVNLLKDKILEHTKVGWMLGWGRIDQPINDQNWKKSTYGSMKVTNLMMMKGFAHTKIGIFYAIYIKSGIDDDRRVETAKTIFEFQEKIKKENNGQSMFEDGTLFNYYTTPPLPNHKKFTTL